MANPRLGLGFLFLYDWLPAFEALPPKDFKELLLALIRLQREGEPLPPFKNPNCTLFGSMIAPAIARRLAGQKGGNATQATTQASEQATTQASTQDSEQGSEQGTCVHPSQGRECKSKDKYIYIYKDVRARTCAREGDEDAVVDIPTKNDISDYIAEKGYKVKAERFFAYYEQRGWMDARGVPLRNWRSVVDSWAANDIDGEDKVAAEKESMRTFDVDDFFEHALSRSYDDRKKRRTNT